jgi:hypothetical protein
MISSSLRVNKSARGEDERMRSTVLDLIIKWDCKSSLLSVCALCIVLILQ